MIEMCLKNTLDHLFGKNLIKVGAKSVRINIVKEPEKTQMKLKVISAAKIQTKTSQRRIVRNIATSDAMTIVHMTSNTSQSDAELCEPVTNATTVSIGC